jgi:NADH:ubiquinone oxidoreductase subunit E
MIYKEELWLPLVKNKTGFNDRLAEVIEEKKDLRNPLIEVLRIAQEIFGYLPIEVQEFVAEKMNISRQQNLTASYLLQLLFHETAG